jgi:transketolase
MPSSGAFDAQDAAWREAVLPRAVTRRLAVEAAARQSWWRYVGSDGEVIGIDSFGASGKAADLSRHFGITADHVVAAVGKLLA